MRVFETSLGFSSYERLLIYLFGFKNVNIYKTFNGLLRFFGESQTDKVVDVIQSKHRIKTFQTISTIE